MHTIPQSYTLCTHICSVLANITLINFTSERSVIVDFTVNIILFDFTTEDSVIVDFTVNIILFHFTSEGSVIVDFTVNIILFHFTSEGSVIVDFTVNIILFHFTSEGSVIVDFTVHITLFHFTSEGSVVVDFTVHIRDLQLLEADLKLTFNNGYQEISNPEYIIDTSFTCKYPTNSLPVVSWFSQHRVSKITIYIYISVHLLVSLKYMYENREKMYQRFNSVITGT